MSDFQLKDRYSRTFYEKLGADIQKQMPTFDIAHFMTLIFDKNWEAKALKERMHHTAIVLNEVLSGSYQEKIEVLRPVAAGCKDGLLGLIFPDFVETFGLEEENKTLSIEALAYFTQYSSSEFAVRPFIMKYETEMMLQLLSWASDKNHHIRRLASEGCRPRLPWAMALPKFKKDPTPILPILEVLKADETDYVRRSVANNLNDISKDNPDLVLKIAARWQGNNKNTDWIVKHACRTLLKKGDTRAMQLFDFADATEIKIENLQIEKTRIAIGEHTYFSFKIANNSATSTKLRLEFGIYYMKSNGKQNRKVFQIAEKTYDSQFAEEIRRKINFQNLTTRKHYAGEHKLVLIMNGVECDKVDFELLD